MGKRKIWVDAQSIRRVIKDSADAQATELASATDGGHPAYIDVWPISGSILGQYVTLWYASELTAAEVEGLTCAIRRALADNGIAARDVELLITHGWGLRFVQQLAKRSFELPSGT